MKSDAEIEAKILELKKRWYLVFDYLFRNRLEKQVYDYKYDMDIILERVGELNWVLGIEKPIEPNDLIK